MKGGPVDLWMQVSLAWHYGLPKKERKGPVIELYPHQQKAVDEMHNGSILWGGVGTGKTITSLVYYYTKVCGGVVGDPGTMRTPKDIYIITTAKKRDSKDWEHDGLKMLIGPDREASQEGIKMTVDSWNNIEKYLGVENAFFVFDEQRLVGSGAWSKAFIKIAKHNEWVLLSATPGDTWIDYIPVFIANGFYKNRTEFKRRHVVYNTYSKFPKIDHYVEVGHLVKLRNSILVEMPYLRHTTRVIEDIIVDYDEELFEKASKKRWHVYENRPLRDVSELFSVLRKIVNSDDTRLDAIRSLLSRHPKLIVFYNFDYELEKLRTITKDQIKNPSLAEAALRTPSTGSMSSMRSANQSSESPSTFSIAEWSSESSTPSPSPDLPLKDQKNTSQSEKCSTFAVAEWNGHKHQQIPETDSWLYLVQYVAGAEGWNCTETDAMAFYSQTYSYKNFHQAHGRIDRLNTPFTILHYYNLISKSIMDRAVRKSLKHKKNFNEKDFIGKEKW